MVRWKCGIICDSTPDFTVVPKDIHLKFKSSLMIADRVQQGLSLADIYSSRRTWRTMVIAFVKTIETLVKPWIKLVGVLISESLCSLLNWLLDIDVAGRERSLANHRQPGIRGLLQIQSLGLLLEERTYSGALGWTGKSNRLHIIKWWKI